MQFYEYLNKSWQHGILSRIGCVSTLPPAQLPSYERGHSRSWLLPASAEYSFVRKRRPPLKAWLLLHAYGLCPTVKGKTALGSGKLVQQLKWLTVQVWSLKVNPLNSREGERREQTSQSYPLIFTPVPWNMLLPPRVSYIHADAHTIS